MGNCAGIDWASEKHDVLIADPGAADQSGVGIGSLLLSVERRHIQPERDCAPRSSFARTGAIPIVDPDARLAPIDIRLNQFVD
jgi:hypothetical protein